MNREDFEAGKKLFERIDKLTGKIDAIHEVAQFLAKNGAAVNRLKLCINEAEVTYESNPDAFDVILRAMEHEIMARRRHLSERVTPL